MIIIPLQKIHEHVCHDCKIVPDSTSETCNQHNGHAVYVLSSQLLHVCTSCSVFDKLIWRIIGTKGFLFGTAQFSLWASGTINYDSTVTNSINSLLIGSRCIPNGAHTNHC